MAEPKDFRTYLRPVLKRWWLILAVVPLVTIGTYFYYDGKDKVYQSSTQLFVQPSAIDRILLGNTGGATTEATVENLALLIQTSAVATEASRILAKAGEKVPSGAISAQPFEGSNFINLSASAASPRAAARLANAFATAFVRTQARQFKGETNQTLEAAQGQLEDLGVGSEDLVERETLEDQIQTLELIGSQSSSTGIRIVEKAFPSPTPIDHDPLSQAIFALIVSLMLSVAAAFGLEYMTRKISSVDDVEEIFELPVLTEIPKVGDAAPIDGNGIGMEKQLHEPFHRLQMNLDMLSHERPLRSILVVSAAPGEGKSIVSRNLALGFREAGHNVAVLDADFRKATLGGLLNAQEGPGLTDILSGRANFGQAVQEVAVPAMQNGNGTSGDHLQAAAVAGAVRPTKHGDLVLVPAGSHHGNLAATLASGGLRQTLKTASEVFDRVVIDSSPILAAADVLPLLSEVDGVLVVTRVGVTSRDSAKRLLSELKRVTNAHVVGVVVNGIPPRTYRARAYGYYYG